MVMSAKPKLKMSGDEELQLSVQSIESEENCVAEDIPLDIVYQDESIIVINKPADFVVHPAAGHYSGTMQNALLHHDASLARDTESRYRTSTGQGYHRLDGSSTKS